jgi:hypothetical protein
MLPLLLGASLRLQVGDAKDTRFVWEASGAYRVAERTLRGVPTRKGVKLVVYEWAHGLPSLYRLYADEGKTSERADRITAFAGKMNIRSEKDALRFVRLYTSVDTGCFGEEWEALELMAPSQFRKATFYGQPEYSDWSTIHMNGFAGIVFSKALQKEVEGYPVVEKDATGFTVTRPIFRQSWQHPTQQLIIREHVERDGTYQLLSEQPITTGPLAEVEWFYPSRK